MNERLKSWCVDHMREDADCFFLDEPGGGYCLIVNFDCTTASIYEYESGCLIDIADSPTVEQMEKLCDALNIKSVVQS